MGRGLCRSERTASRSQIMHEMMNQTTVPKSGFEMCFFGVPAPTGVGGPNQNTSQILYVKASPPFYSYDLLISQHMGINERFFDACVCHAHNQCNGRFFDACFNAMNVFPVLAFGRLMINAMKEQTEESNAFRSAPLPNSRSLAEG